MSKNNVKEISRVADNAAITIESAAQMALVQTAALERSVTGAEINADARAARVAALRDLEAGIERAYSGIGVELQEVIK